MDTPTRLTLIAIRLGEAAVTHDLVELEAPHDLVPDVLTAARRSPAGDLARTRCERPGPGGPDPLAHGCGGRGLPVDRCLPLRRGRDRAARSTGRGRPAQRVATPMARRGCGVVSSPRCSALDWSSAALMKMAMPVNRPWRASSMTSVYPTRGRRRIFGIVGDPVSHSLSPVCTMRIIARWRFRRLPSVSGRGIRSILGGAGCQWGPGAAGPAASRA